MQGAPASGHASHPASPSARAGQRKPGTAALTGVCRWGPSPAQLLHSHDSRRSAVLGIILCFGASILCAQRGGSSPLVLDRPEEAGPPPTEGRPRPVRRRYRDTTRCSGLSRVSDAPHRVQPSRGGGLCCPVLVLPGMDPSPMRRRASPSLPKHGRVHASDFCCADMLRSVRRDAGQSVLWLPFRIHAKSTAPTHNHRTRVPQPPAQTTQATGACSHTKPSGAGGSTCRGCAMHKPPSGCHSRASAVCSGRASFTDRCAGGPSACARAPSRAPAEYARGSEGWTPSRCRARSAVAGTPARTPVCQGPECTTPLPLLCTCLMCCDER